MARLQCRSCGFDQEIEWDGRLVCPSCGSTNARVAARTEELPDAEIEMITHSEIPEELRWNSKDVEEAPAMILRCGACGYEFNTAKEIAAWPTGCPKCRHPRVRLADCVDDVEIDLQKRTIKALPEIEFRDYGDADPYQSLKRTLGREPTARDVEIYVAARRAAKKDDDE